MGVRGCVLTDDGFGGELRHGAPGVRECLHELLVQVFELGVSGTMISGLHSGIHWEPVSVCLPLPDLHGAALAQELARQSGGLLHGVNGSA